MAKIATQLAGPLRTHATPGTATQINAAALPCKRALITVDRGSANIWIGPDSNANYRELLPGEEYEIPFLNHAMRNCTDDLSGWYVRCPAASSQLFTVIYEPK